MSTPGGLRTGFLRHRTYALSLLDDARRPGDDQHAGAEAVEDPAHDRAEQPLARPPGTTSSPVSSGG